MNSEKVWLICFANLHFIKLHFCSLFLLNLNQCYSRATIRAAMLGGSDGILPVSAQRNAVLVHRKGNLPN